MIEQYLLEQALKQERALLDQESARCAATSAVQRALPSPMSTLRRRLALLLLALADRLDPRPVLSSAHTARRPLLNGKLHHA